VPASSLAALAAFHHDAIELGAPQLHSHKLRIGHLHGNRFAIVVRRTVPDAIDRAAAKIERINDEGGLVNAFGPQRFGPEGRGLDRGLAALRGGRGGPRGNMIVAAGQAALFNLWLELRRERGLARRALVGDVLAKRGPGGLFTCTDPAIDDERLADGELVVTGPIFGSRTMAPPEGSPSDALEREVLAIAGVDPSALRALGRAAVGTRRASFVSLVDVALSRAEPRDDHGDGVRVEVTLPAGSYATQLCRELQEEAPQAP
jgi:tRNA pseudouridine13 synthase